jgi:crotonobetainyl-CoA:carnitine CoA-transferase CaiB-like acyl-CoA transferase
VGGRPGGRRHTGRLGADVIKIGGSGSWGSSRAGNATELVGELDVIFAAKPLDEWAKAFAGEPDFFWSPIDSIDDVVADEQFHAAGGVVYVPDEDCRRADGRHACGPKLGEHTDEVLAELNARQV